MGNLTKRDISIVLGNIVDHYDIALFSFFAPTIGPLFFPAYDPVVQLILTYGLSITSFISKPLGTYLFGILARDYGPIFALSYSLIGVAITTVWLGCVPSYAYIGWYAPLIVMSVRIIRGTCAAGESTIAKLYIMENKSNHHALYASYAYQSSSMVGTLIASVAATAVLCLGYTYAWRICFWVGGMTGLIGYWLRSTENKNNAASMSALQSSQQTRIALIWYHRKNVMRVALTNCFSHVTYAIPFVFLNSFMPLISEISLETMMLLNTSLLIFDMVLIPVIGSLLVQLNQIKVMMLASCALSVTIVPLFYFLPCASLGYITFMRIWIVFWGVVFLCPLDFWARSLFTRHEQYFLVGMSNALGSATLGRMTTSICFFIWYATGIVYAPAVYLMLIMCGTMFAVKTATSVTEYTGENHNHVSAQEISMKII